MAITLRTAGTWVAANATTQTVTLPTHATGDMLIVRVGFKHATMPTTVTCGTAGWNKLGETNGTGGASSNGGGGVQVALFWKEATSAAETNPVITFNGGVTAATPSAAVAMAYQKGADESWVTPEGAGAAIAAATSISATIDSHISATVGDLIDEFHVTNDNTTLTVPTFTQAGLTLDTVTESPAAALSDTLSNDISADGCYRKATAGTSSAAAVITGTNSVADVGAGWTTRLRVVPKVQSAQAQAFIGYTSASDTFTRSVTDGVGTADSGGDWYIHRGSATHFDVDGSTLVISNFSDTTKHTVALRQIASSPKFEASIDFSLASLPPTNTEYDLGLIQYTSSTTPGLGGLGTQIEIGSTGTIKFWPLYNGLAGTRVTPSPSITYIAGETWTFKGSLYQINTYIFYRFKTWKVGTTEPDWQVTGTQNNSTNVKAGIVITDFDSTTTTATTATLDNFNYSTNTALTNLGQAQAFIVKSKGLGQAQARVLKPYTDVMTQLSPTSWWRLGDSSGNFLDQIGSLHLSENGTVTRGVKNYRIKVDDGSVYFPTSSDYLSRADDVAFDLGNATWSIVFWAARLADSGGYEIILSKGVNAYAVGITSGDYFAFFKDSAAILTISDYAVPADGTRHMYVVTRAATNDTRLYVDGVERSKTYDDTTTTLSDTASALQIGRDVGGGDPGFQGVVDEPALFKGKVLTATEISDLYASRVIGTPDRVAYVSPSGNNVTGDGSVTSPWFGLPRALTSVCPGDEIQCRAGTYTTTTGTTTGARGSPMAPIRVNPYPSEKPIFSGNNTETTFLLFQDSAWITIQHIHVQNYRTNNSGVIMASGDTEGIIIRDVILTGASGVNAGATDHFIYVGGGVTASTAPRNILVENCWLEGVTGASALNGAGLHIYSDSAGGTPYTGQQITFRNNLVLNIDFGAIVWGRATSVRMTHNTFVNVDTGLKVHSNEPVGTFFRDNIILGTGNSTLVQLTGTIATITEDYNYLSQDGTFATTIYYSDPSSMNQATWISTNGNGVHDIVTGDRDDSQFDAGWFPISGSAIAAASDGLDMGRLQFSKGFAQAQAKIIVATTTVTVSAQSQGWIKATAQKAYSQAQADIKATSRSYAQAQATIRGNAFAQAQADIKQTYRGHAQAQATIRGNAFGQAQAQIKQTYRGFGQANASIVTTSRGFAQANALIDIPQVAHPISDISVTGWVRVVI